MYASILIEVDPDKMEQYDLDTQCMLKYFGPVFRIVSFVFA